MEPLRPGAHLPQARDLRPRRCPPKWLHDDAAPRRVHHRHLQPMPVERTFEALLGAQ